MEDISGTYISANLNKIVIEDFFAPKCLVFFNEQNLEKLCTCNLQVFHPLPNFEWKEENHEHIEWLLESKTENNSNPNLSSW